MANDGMIVNFEIGDDPIIPKLSFQGGRWRDRLIAKKGAAKRATGGNRATQPNKRELFRENRHDVVVEEYIGSGAAPNPAKRPRIDNQGPENSKQIPTILRKSHPLKQEETRPDLASKKLPHGSVVIGGKNKIAIPEETPPAIGSCKLPLGSIRIGGTSAHENKKATFHQDRRSMFVAGKLPPGSIKIGGEGGSKKIFSEEDPRNLQSGSNYVNRDAASVGKPAQTISSLFSFNPSSKTKHSEQKEKAEPVKPSNAPLTPEMATFTALGLSPRLAAHLSMKLNMKAPTAIQKAAIAPLIKNDDDAFIQAETGSGKTLAYLLPIVERLFAMSGPDTQIHRDSGLFAVILSPTRELCKQIAAVLEKLLRCAPWIVGTTVIGGESKQSEKARLRKGVNILIATPGRLADHLDNTEALNVSSVRWLILDEGDRLMELGFEEDIKGIVEKLGRRSLPISRRNGIDYETLPKRRVTILCSATMKMNVQRLGEISLKDAIHIVADTSNEESARDDPDDGGVGDGKKFTAPAQLKQTYAVVPAKLRLVTLTAILKRAFARRGSVMKAIIFMSCADAVDFHFALFSRPTGISAEETEEDELPQRIIVTTRMTKDTIAHATAFSSPYNTVILHRMHGSLAQNIRTATLKAFTEASDPCVMICTDVASRGLDLPNVDYVIEYDPPFNADDHLHRVGRTARAGREGRALIFLLPGEEEEYISILAAGYHDGVKALTHQSAEELLRKGFGGTGQEWEERATAWQLESERWAQDSPKYLEMARRGFQSHIRAYATHVAPERHIFNMQKLHLGHLAKAFALRDKPGSIKVPGLRPTKMTAADRHVAARKAKRGEMMTADGERAHKEWKAERDRPEADDAARRMKKKMKEHMALAHEFNIG